MRRGAALVVSIALVGAVDAAPARDPGPARGSRAAAAGAWRASSPGAGAPRRRAGRPRRASRYVAPPDAATSPAYRYGQLGPAECEAELAQRGIGFQREVAIGVLAPVRLTAPLRGVVFRTDLAAAARATTPWEIADCRLVLALDDFAEILRQHDVVEVRHYSMYRPPARGWPADSQAAQHAGALALDAGRLIQRDGRVLSVEQHFFGAIGAPTCGPRAAPRRRTPEALKLRAILCEAVAQRLFHVVLTPNYDRPHRNHFHLELVAGAAWFLVH
jgi:hypothetical protein